METHSNDAHRLLAKLTHEPAYVFGSSSGAVIGLDLCTRHPEQVRVLISHEPILLELLSGDELIQAKQFMEDLKKHHRSEVMKLLSNLEMETSNPESSKGVLKEFLLGNSTYFTEYEIPGILNYSLDIDALKTALTSTSIQILMAGGSDSRDFFPYSCAEKLAKKLDTEIVVFPGHHGGYNTLHHKAFAEKLYNVLANS